MNDTNKIKLEDSIYEHEISKRSDKSDELVDFFCRLSGMERGYIAKFINTKLANLELSDIERVHNIFVNDNSVKTNEEMSK